MRKPKMILFDYGQTLLCEPGLDFLRGEEALFQYVKRNKRGITPKQARDASLALFERLGTVREMGFELHECQFQRVLYESLGIELSIPYPEAEIILWRNASEGACMPNAERMLDAVNACGIRSGVVSNIGWSGAALTERINRLLPRNRFEWIIASSEYIFRKPSPLLFEIALQKAGLSAADVWFCGDSVAADVEGSAAVGMFPVWYQGAPPDGASRAETRSGVPACEHLPIHDWLELIDVLEGLK